MRIYAVADIHSNKDKIELIKDTIRQFQPDVLVIAGDITNHFNPEPLIEQISRLPIHILAICGNTDSNKVEKLLTKYSNLFSLHLNKKIVNSIDFVGLNGTIPIPFYSKICFGEEQMLNKIEHLITKDTVLVVHPPPRNILDEAFGIFHAGSKNLYDMVLKLEPKILICGHIHEQTGTAILGKTHVVNCSIGRKGAGAIIEYEKDSTPIISILI
ncbi:MAG: metallophosphoesterase family protein [Desulfobacterales bacterium]|nr:metallophosphoesterase family protein [Desulfobacterales bacterium]MBF0396489.1 metallophosphoesterase family protein [Desulfobacterales bacterium]